MVSNKENLRKNWLRAERKIDKSEQSRRHGIERLINSERVCGKYFVSGKPAPYWHKHDVNWVPTLQLTKKKYRAKLNHNANAERAERAKKRYELARGRTRARTEETENVESLWKAVFLLLRSPSVSQLLQQKKREIKTKGIRRPFLLIRRP